MSRRLEGTGVTLNLVHPGVVNTHHGRHTPFFANLFLKLSLYPFFWLMTKSAFNGAQTVIFCAVAETVKVGSTRPVRERISMGEEEGCRPPALQAGHPQKAVRPFGEWPAHRAWKGWAWRGQVKL
jgi:hypothetical protein